MPSKVVVPREGRLHVNLPSQTFIDIDHMARSNHVTKTQIVIRAIRLLKICLRADKTAAEDKENQ